MSSVAYDAVFGVNAGVVQCQVATGPRAATNQYLFLWVEHCLDLSATADCKEIRYHKRIKIEWKNFRKFDHVKIG